jgi:intracellular sulfur oxidation DsrE/DsrF family protein
MREEQMGDLNQDRTNVAPRRNFFGRIAAMSALGLFGFASATARAQPAPSDGPDWPGTLKGRHRQVFDVYDINEGFPLGFANNFLTPNESATAVMIFRHKGLPYAIGSAMWEKYKIGETFKIIDPETKAPAVKNPYFQPKPGALANSEAALDRLLAKGTVMGACGVALRGQSRRLAANAGVTAEEALQEWTANLIPGVTVVPSGTWAVNRAQEAGCTYCAGG